MVPMPLDWTVSCKLPKSEDYSMRMILFADSQAMSCIAATILVGTAELKFGVIFTLRVQSYKEEVYEFVTACPSTWLMTLPHTS